MCVVAGCVGNVVTVFFEPGDQLEVAIEECPGPLSLLVRSIERDFAGSAASRVFVVETLTAPGVVGLIGVERNLNDNRRCARIVSDDERRVANRAPTGREHCGEVVTGLPTGCCERFRNRPVRVNGAEVVGRWRGICLTWMGVATEHLGSALTSVPTHSVDDEVVGRNRRGHVNAD